MSEDKGQDRLEIIIAHLEQNSIALAAIDRRTDSQNKEIRFLCETIKSVAMRQAEQERENLIQSSNLKDIMDSVSERVSAIEQVMTPIPKPFDPKSFEDSGDQSLNVVPGSNGSGTQDMASALFGRAPEQLCEEECEGDDDDEL
jgi:hypothetical protein